jgi:hypothetical protein
MSHKQAQYLADNEMMRKSHAKAQINLRDQVKHPAMFPHTLREKTPDVNYELFPTPCAQDHKHCGPSSRQQGLSDAVRLRPAPKGSFGPSDGGEGTGSKKTLFLTLRAADTGKGEKQETFLKRMGGRTDACFQSLPAQVGGQLNADWTEALMGYPRNWTDIEKDCPFENRYPEAWITGAWEDGIPRIIKGRKNRPRRIKALGNSIVPRIPCLLFLSNKFDGWR